MADGRLSAFSKKRGTMRELYAVGFLNFMTIFYILLLLFDNRGKHYSYIVDDYENHPQEEVT
jgi:hypothetical protein